VKYVIGLGEGAGANVLARFGIANPSRVLGLILINCTGSAASVLENFKNKVCILCVPFSVITVLPTSYFNNVKYLSIYHLCNVLYFFEVRFNPSISTLYDHEHTFNTRLFANTDISISGFLVFLTCDILLYYSVT